MSLPAEVATVPVRVRTFHYRDGSGPVAGKKITLELDTETSIGDLTLVPRKITITLDADGKVPAGTVLPASSDPDASVSSLAYRVTEHWKGGRTGYLNVPKGATEIDLADLVPDAPDPEYTAAVGAAVSAAAAAEAQEAAEAAKASAESAASTASAASVTATNAASTASTAASTATTKAAEAAASATTAEGWADAAQASGSIYASTAAGLAATVDGEYFSVPSADDDEYLILYRRDDASTATEVKRYPSADRVTALEGDVAGLEGRVGTLEDDLAGLTVYENIDGRIEISIGDDGISRVASEQLAGSELVRYPVVASNISSIGTGASLVSGVASIRSIVGTNGINASVEGDEVVIEASDASGAPTEFVVCLVIGQSNNTTQGGNADEATALPSGVAYEFQTGPDRLSDLSSDGQRATVMPAMGREFWRRTGLGVIFVNYAIDSSAMAAAASLDTDPTRNWDATGTLRAAAVNKLNACRAYLDAEGYCWQNGWICWSQGEQDGKRINDGVITIDDYKDAFPGLIDYLKAEVGQKVPFLITRTAWRGTDDSTGYQQVRAAQMEFAATIDGVFMAYTGTLSFRARSLMADSVHYNQAGKNEVGTRVGAVAAILATGVN